MTRHSDPILVPIERPRCTRCQTRMMLARIEPLRGRSDKRTFECPNCSFIETTIVGDPIKSEAIARLAAAIRPPT
jgi:hypothetical protein